MRLPCPTAYHVTFKSIMHALDIIFAAIAILFTIIGIKRGLIGEVVRLVAMVAGFFIAFIYYDDFTRHTIISKLPLQTELKNAVSFFIIYIVCLLAIIGIGWIIRKAIHLTPLGIVDRIAGGTIGILKATLIAWVVCLSISSLPVKRVQTDFKTSIVYRTYKSLPKPLSLKSMLKLRNQLRTIFPKHPAPKIGAVQEKISKLRDAVDSAKAASSGKD